MSDVRRLPGPAADVWAWQFQGACRGMDSAVFFHPERERGTKRAARERAAKQVCERCPVKIQCAQHAIAVREAYGTWGGMSETERAALLSGARDDLRDELRAVG